MLKDIKLVTLQRVNNKYKFEYCESHSERSGFFLFTILIELITQGKNRPT